MFLVSSLTNVSYFSWLDTFWTDPHVYTGSQGSGNKMVDCAPGITWNIPKGWGEVFHRQTKINRKQKLISIKIIITPFEVDIKKKKDNKSLPLPS